MQPLWARVSRAFHSRLLHAERLRALAFARFGRDGCYATVGGDRVSVRVARAAVTDLGQQRGRGRTDPSPEEAAEDLPVGVGVQRLGDLGFELGDLPDHVL